MKTCGKCKIYKVDSSFSKDRSTKTGLSSSCKECVRSYQKLNRDLLSTSQKLRRSKIKDKIKEYNAARKTIRNEKRNIRYKNDLNYKLSHILRSRITNAAKNRFKVGSAIKDLGCSISDFKLYIEKQFQPGMTWENYGFYTWHIDHITPLCHFDLTNREQFLKATHFSNLRPIWSEDHKIKSSQERRN
jgi:hypothetical protein